MDIIFENTISLADIVAIIVGSLGAMLGVMNTLKSISNDRVKLIVRPKTAIPIGNADQEIDFCIEVLNKSIFPVTIVDIGFLLKGTKNRACILPIMIDGEKFPRKLEPRTSFTAYLKASSVKLEKVKCAYAKTDCGVIKTGKSPALKYIENLH